MVEALLEAVAGVGYLLEAAYQRHPLAVVAAGCLAVMSIVVAVVAITR